MAWDSSRQVPWPKVVKLLGFYLVIVNAMILLLGRSDYDVGVFLSTLFGGTVYLLLTVVLVKFGWNPFAFGRRSAPSDASASRPGKGQAAAAPPAKAKPAPTKRTNAGNPKAKTGR